MKDERERHIPYLSSRTHRGPARLLNVGIGEKAPSPQNPTPTPAGDPPPKKNVRPGRTLRKERFESARKDAPNGAVRVGFRRGSERLGRSRRERAPRCRGRRPTWRRAGLLLHARLWESFGQKPPNICSFISENQLQKLSIASRVRMIRIS